jgi:hypothetical protein
VVGSQGWRLGESGADANPGRCDGFGPAPSGVDAYPNLASAAGDAGSGVQDQIAECGDLTASQAGLVAEAENLGPGDQIGCCQDDFKPSCVFGVESVGRQVAQPVASACRMRSSTRVCWRCRSSSPASWPGICPSMVSVRKPPTRRRVSRNPLRCSPFDERPADLPPPRAYSATRTRCRIPRRESAGPCGRQP